MLEILGITFIFFIIWVVGEVAIFYFSPSSKVTPGFGAIAYSIAWTPLVVAVMIGTIIWYLL